MLNYGVKYIECFGWIFMKILCEVLYSRDTMKVWLIDLEDTMKGTTKGVAWWSNKDQNMILLKFKNLQKKKANMGYVKHPRICCNCDKFDNWASCWKNQRPIEALTQRTRYQQGFKPKKKN